LEGFIFWKTFWGLSKTYPWFHRKAHCKTEKEAEQLIFRVQKRIIKERKGKTIKEFEI
jgi:hypothetical protein